MTEEDESKEVITIVDDEGEDGDDDDDEAEHDAKMAASLLPTISATAVKIPVSTSTAPAVGLAKIVPLRNRRGLLSPNGKPYVYIAITGTCGRDENHKRLTAELWELSIKVLTKKISEENGGTDWSHIILVGGLAAWMDHLVIRLFLNHIIDGIGGCILYSPAALVDLAKVNTPAKRRRFRFEDELGSCGARTNSLHKEFSNTLASAMTPKTVYGSDFTGGISMSDIWCAVQLGAEVHTFGSFLERNKAIAMGCDKMYALTWSPDKFPPVKSGTGQTWRLCPLPAADKHHYRLAALEVHLKTARDTAHYLAAFPNARDSPPKRSIRLRPPLPTSVAIPPRPPARVVATTGRTEER